MGILAPIVPVLAEALQPRTEVVLHDLTRMPNTIAAIGRPITGRGVGGPPTDLGVRTFRSGSSDHLIGYRTEVDGLSLRSSSIFFRAASGKGVACLCINSDIDALRRAIETGVLAPGARLVERELCDQLQVSRTSLREASAALARKSPPVDVTA